VKKKEGKLDAEFLWKSAKKTSMTQRIAELVVEFLMVINIYEFFALQYQ